MGSYQIWPCHVTQAENLSFPYLKSYCPLNSRKSHHISRFCCIPNGSYKEDNLKDGRICLPPKCGIGLRCETLYIADYEYVNISNFTVLDIKLWLEEDSSLDIDQAGGGGGGGHCATPTLCNPYSFFALLCQSGF